MIDEKKRLLTRREAKKIKQRQRKDQFDLDTLRWEVYTYRLHFGHQLQWNQLLPQAVLYQCSRPMNKEQQHRAMEGNHDQ